MDASPLTNLLRAFQTFARGNETRHESVGLAFEEIVERQRVGEPIPSPAGATQRNEERKDSVCISEQAKAAYEMERIIHIVKSAPDVRELKPEELKEKLANKILMKKVSEKVAEALGEALYASIER
jgi:hypothetical protein